MTPRTHAAQSNPGDTTPCRHRQHAYQCPANANACTREPFVDGEYKAQGGTRRLMCRAYRCSAGHLFRVTWTEEKGAGS